MVLNIATFGARPGGVPVILLIRCCVTYLDHSHNVIQFFDMPWILTTVAFNRLISVAIKLFYFFLLICEIHACTLPCMVIDCSRVSAICVIRRTVPRLHSTVITFSDAALCIKAIEVNSFVYFQVVHGVPQAGSHNLFCM
ncbi:uncharacterized protein LOC126872957 isoform X3 [Bombus huntii]|uniref:uncharacterized protein LOC126872957 isoform X3 n=1 Tax=Bombus huntii TaxID=85661 RepID=UPI0021AA4B67|nr:uncharacterized protein LOC126872957 isoform X3 [Bombus huntii]XP_050489208.1 uncharacterized protein LOC126872957 isoform X3 [Bombus huntii]XP_050489209.1 uncharacterized protein LOC126872957 isoform X3 [Bombus huntii]